MDEKNINDSLEPSDSLEKAYERYVAMLYRICYSITKNSADAEDAVSEVFCKLLRSKKSFLTAEHEKAWLIRVAVNKCKDMLRHSSKKNISIDEIREEASVRASFSDETLSIILALPERHKVAIYLHYYEGYTAAQIGKMLKKPQSTILNHLHEGRKLLKGVITDEG